MRDLLDQACPEFPPNCELTTRHRSANGLRAVTHTPSVASMLTINGQTELLNGVDQHGEPLVRPDGVYKTGVVQPTATYRPITDSREVARQFTLAGAADMAVQGRQLQLLGLHGTNLGLWARIKFWWAGISTAGRAAKIVQAAVNARAEAQGVSKSQARAQLFAYGLPDMHSADGYPGGAPTGAQTSQEAFAAEAIVNASSSKQYSSPRTQSAGQAGMQIAPGLISQPARLAAQGGPQGRVGAVAAQTAIARFFAANKGREG